MLNRKQRGMGLLDVLFAIALLGLIYTGIAKWALINKEKNAAQDYRTRIEHVVEALQKYQYQQKIIKPPVAVIDQFPTNLNALMTSSEQFWINCTAADEAARRCIRPDYLPWSSRRIGYEAGRKTVTIGSDLRDIAYAKLTFPLSSTAIQPIYRAKWATELLKVPYSKALSNGDITVMVYDPLLSQLYDEFLQRDGSVKLTDDWDVGGDHGITNAKDYTIKNSDGTQKLVSSGLVNIVSVEHGDKVSKPSCPVGLFPKIALSIAYIEVANEDELAGSSKPFIMSQTSDYWKIGYQTVLINRETGQFKDSTDGRVNALIFCGRYK